jgi:hypothetical protein
MESRIQEAVDYLQVHPELKVAAIARQFNVPYGCLRYRLKGRAPKKGSPAANIKLSQAEEKALCHYIDRLDRINLAVRVEFVTDTTNYILKEHSSQAASEDCSTVGPNWTTRFLKRHKYFKRMQKKLHSDRQESEDIPRVNRYFIQLQAVLQNEGISPDDIWNMDETGFRIGVGKNQMIVTKHRRVHYFGIPENRESATAIEAISVGRNHIPAFLIFAGQLHVAHWYQQPELDDRTAIVTSASGYSNDEISFMWPKHFNKYSKTSQVGRKRLLILDGHGSHHTKEFIQYCDDNNIIPFGMPPNLTHLL